MKHEGEQISKQTNFMFWQNTWPPPHLMQYCCLTTLPHPLPLAVLWKSALNNPKTSFSFQEVLMLGWNVSAKLSLLVLLAFCPPVSSLYGWALLVSWSWTCWLFTVTAWKFWTWTIRWFYQCTYVLLRSWWSKILSSILSQLTRRITPSLCLRG